MSLVGYDVSSGESEDEDNDRPVMVKNATPKLDVNSDRVEEMSNGRTKLSSLLPKPKDSSAPLVGVVNSKGSIKIAVPKLLDSDSDDESSPITKAIINPNTDGKPRCGLFAKLPAPSNSISGKQPNRTFVPHVFSKKKENDKVEKPNVAGKSDSHGTSGLSIKEIRKRSAQAAAKLISKTAATSIENSDSDDESSVNFFSYVEKVPDSEVAPETSSIQVTPTFEVTQPEYDEPDLETTSMREKASEYIPYSVQTPDVPVPQISAKDLRQEDIVRLQGKRRKMEEINFIDINADDALVGNKEQLLKSISEEKELNRSSHSKKKNANTPSGIQKKKHQLSYLVHEAQKRELELKKMWSQNRSSRMQTQSKYGF